MSVCVYACVCAFACVCLCVRLCTCIMPCCSRVRLSAGICVCKY